MTYFTSKLPDGEKMTLKDKIEDYPIMNIGKAIIRRDIAQAIKEMKEELTNSFYESKEIEDTIWFSKIETLLDNQLTRIEKIFGDFNSPQLKKDIDDGSNDSMSGDTTKHLGQGNKDEHMPSVTDTQVEDNLPITHCPLKEETTK